MSTAEYVKNSNYNADYAYLCSYKSVDKAMFSDNVRRLGSNIRELNSYLSGVTTDMFDRRLKNIAIAVLPSIQSFTYNAQLKILLMARIEGDEELENILANDIVSGGNIIKTVAKLAFNNLVTRSFSRVELDDKNFASVIELAFDIGDDNWNTPGALYKKGTMSQKKYILTKMKNKHIDIYKLENVYTMIDNYFDFIEWYISLNYQYGDTMRGGVCHITREMIDIYTVEAIVSEEKRCKSFLQKNKYTINMTVGHVYMEKILPLAELDLPVLMIYEIGKELSVYFSVLTMYYHWKRIALLWGRWLECRLEN